MQPVDRRASPSGSRLYLLERSDVGLVQPNRALEVVAMNRFAARIAGGGQAAPPQDGAVIINIPELN